MDLEVFVVVLEIQWYMWLDNPTPSIAAGLLDPEHHSILQRRKKEISGIHHLTYR